MAKKKRKSEPDVRDIGYRDRLSEDEIQRRSRRAQVAFQLWSAERRLECLKATGATDDILEQAAKIVENLKEQLDGIHS